MREIRCPHEDELLDALGRGFVDPDLRSHLRECSPCRELELVAGSLLEDRSLAVATAAVPSASAMWVRMQIRARLQAEARARRTLVIGQAISLLVAVLLVVTVVGGYLAASIPDLIMATGWSSVLILASAGATVLLGWTAHLVFARG